MSSFVYAGFNYYEFNNRGQSKLFHEYVKFYKRSVPFPSNYHLNPRECLKVYLKLSAPNFRKRLRGLARESCDYFCEILLDAISHNSYVRFEYDSGYWYYGDD
jgi:hypothetical protein